MAKLCITIAELDKFKPCAETGRRVRKVLRAFDPDKAKCFSAADARAAGCTYDDIIWAASAIAKTDDDVARRLVGFLNDNAKRVLHIFEEAAPNDMRVRQCIQATDDWLADEITEDRWKEAARDAWAARAARDARAAWAAWAARDAWDARAAWAAWDAWAAWAARDARDAWAAWDAEFYEWQFDRLIEWLAPEAPEPLPMSAVSERIAA